MNCLTFRCFMLLFVCLNNYYMSRIFDAFESKGFSSLNSAGCLFGRDDGGCYTQVSIVSCGDCFDLDIKTDGEVWFWLRGIRTNKILRVLEKMF
jgi:hypothetical protein